MAVQITPTIYQFEAGSVGNAQRIARQPGTNTIYALLASAGNNGQSNANFYAYQLWKSTDGGNTWSVLATLPNLTGQSLTGAQATFHTAGSLVVTNQGDIYVLYGTSVKTSSGSLTCNAGLVYWNGTSFNTVTLSYQMGATAGITTFLVADQNENLWGGYTQGNIQNYANLIFVPKQNVAGYSTINYSNTAQYTGYINNAFWDSATNSIFYSYDWYSSPNYYDGIMKMTPNSITAPTTMAETKLLEWGAGNDYCVTISRLSNGNMLVVRAHMGNVDWSAYVYTTAGTLVSTYTTTNLPSTLWSSDRAYATTDGNNLYTLFSTGNSDAGNNSYVGYSKNGGAITNLETVNAASCHMYLNVANFPSDAAQTTQMHVDYMYAPYYSSAFHGAFFDNISFNNPPNAPTFSNITSNGSTINKNAHLFFNVSDPDSGNTIQDMWVEIATDSGFTNLVASDKYSVYPTRFQGMPTPNNTSNQVVYLNPNANPVGTLYVRAQCMDNNNAWSAWSATQSFTVANAPWSDTPSGPGFKAQWMNDLATVIDNAHKFRGWNPMGFSDGSIVAGTGVDLRAQHVVERRIGISEYMRNFNIGVTPSWTNADLTNIQPSNVATCGWLAGSTSGMGGAWTPNGGGTLTVDTSTVYPGTPSSFKATNTYTAAQAMNTYTSNFPATAGSTYSMGVYVKATAGKSVQLAAWFKDSTGANIAGSSYTDTITASGGWDFISIAGMVAATGTTQAEWEVDVSSCAVNESYWVGPSFYVQGNPWALDRSSQHITELRNYCAQM